MQPRSWCLVVGCIVVLLGFEGCSSTAPRFGGTGEGAAVYRDETPPGIDRDRVLLDVVSYLGAPYAYGGRSKDGLDCSAFTAEIYADALQIALPRSTKEQFEMGIPVDENELAFGDLVFFNTTGENPSHVGIYIENGLFAHASSSEGVTFSSLENSYFKERFVGARRLVH